MDIRDAKQQVIKAGQELCQSGLIARTWGNVSCRTGEDSFVITASGRNYMTLTDDEVIEVKISDLSYEGDIKPSSEKKVHREIYRLKPEANFVIHTHQNNASAVSAMGVSQITLDKEYPSIGDKILCAEYGLPGTKKLCFNTAEAVKASDGKAIIMKHHGAVCYGRDYDEAFEVAHVLEEACGRYLESIGVESWVQEWSGNKQQDDYQNCTLWNKSPLVLKFTEEQKILKPYLDDFAQLAGTKLKVTDSEEEIKKAMNENTPILVKGKGALCVATRQGDREALYMVIEKNCRAFFAAQAYTNGAAGKPIKSWECALMRQIYLKKYSKLGE
ncbi:MAG: class II aldolase/adducin family protein [Clostridiales bacterium]|nr:class II aldolase/adducin family protein [Clostridiales bacterium]